MPLPSWSFGLTHWSCLSSSKVRATADALSALLLVEVLLFTDVPAFCVCACDTCDAEDDRDADSISNVLPFGRGRFWSTGVASVALVDMDGGGGGITREGRVPPPHDHALVDVSVEHEVAQLLQRENALSHLSFEVQETPSHLLSGKTEKAEDG